MSDSEASIISKEDAFKPPPIDNSGLCVQEPSGSKKLPSLTNEGKEGRRKGGGVEVRGRPLEFRGAEPLEVGGGGESRSLKQQEFPQPLTSSLPFLLVEGVCLFCLPLCVSPLHRW